MVNVQELAQGKEAQSMEAYVALSKWSGITAVIWDELPCVCVCMQYFTHTEH